MRKYCVSVVSADLELRVGWAKALREDGADVTELDSIPELVPLMAACGRGIALVDVWPAEKNLPVLFSFLRKYSKSVSLIFFCSGGGLPNDRISALLAAGADDFISAGMDGAVILAKIKAHVRRLHPTIDFLPVIITSKGGSLVVNRSSVLARARDQGGRWHDLGSLTSTELSLLSLFAWNSNRALCRRYIIDSVWQQKGDEINAETVDKYVAALRRKLEPFGKRIESVYGYGYVFRE